MFADDGVAVASRCSRLSVVVVLMKRLSIGHPCGRVCLYHYGRLRWVLGCRRSHLLETCIYVSACEPTAAGL